MIEISGSKPLFPYVFKPQGDKSISHRIAIIGALTNDELKITNYSKSKDCSTTLKCLRAIGVNIDETDDRILIKPWEKNIDNELVIDCENSGTTARLLPSMLGALNMGAQIIGDESLSKRPMNRLIEPLCKVGASLRATEDTLPITVSKAWKLKGKRIELKVASAQIKSALLLTGLFCEGTMEILEPKITRDHTEIMFKEFGISLEREGNSITVAGNQKLKSPREYHVVGDFSSCAYFIALGVLSKEKIMYIKDVGLNPTRTAFLKVMADMGAKIVIKNNRTVNGEAMGDLEVFPSRSQLKGIVVPEELVPNLIDELPLIAVLGAFAVGTTKVTAARELRYKESDRISSVVSSLKKFGVKAKEFDDGFEIVGGTPLVGTEVYCHKDHRIIMSMSIAALMAQGKTTIIDSQWVSISNGHFFNELKKIAPQSLLSDI